MKQIKNETKYCLKCCKLLINNKVKNFCDRDCRRDYYLEIRQDMDDIYSEAKRENIW